VFARLTNVQAKERESLRVMHWEKRGDVQEKANRRKLIKQNPDNFDDDELDDLNREEPVAKDEEKIYFWTLEIWDITHQTGKYKAEKRTTLEQKRQDCNPLWTQIDGTYQSEEIKNALISYWDYLWEKLGYEGKRSMPATSSTWASGASPGDGAGGLYHRG
jgi:hypothetical protein